MPFSPAGSTIGRSGAFVLILLLAPMMMRAQSKDDQAGASKIPNPAEMAKPLTPADKKFLKDASESIYLQLTLAEMAIRRNRPTGASVDAARRVGDKLHPDLKKAWDEFSKFAQAKNEKIRAELASTDKRAVERVRGVEDDKFSKEMIASLDKEGKKLAQLFTSPAIQHPVLRQLAATHAPIFNGHLKEMPQ